MASLAGAGILQMSSARRCARQNRWLTVGRISDSSIEPSVDDNKMPDDVWKYLAKVNKTLWPLLMRVAEAEGADLGGNADAFSRAAMGLATWQDELSRGTIWKDEKGANWPAEKNMRSRWQDLLISKGLPQLVRRYPKLIDPLLESLLEALEEYHNQNMQQKQDQQGGGGGGGSGQSQQQPQAGQQEEEGGGQDEDKDDDKEDKEDEEEEDDDGDGDDEEEDEEKQQQKERENRADQILSQVAEQWGNAANAINAADEAFGSGTGSSMSDGFSLGSGEWHDSVSWKELQQLAKILRKSPELRELIRKLGRRSAVRGPLHKLPEEIFKEGAPNGVIRSPAAPAESSGVTLSGTWDTMLPSEAQLLAAKVPMLRSLHHSRRIEQSLLCYDRSAWLEDSAKMSGRSEMRPLGEAGPLIVCLDTSGSMCGQREVLSKALVVECVRQAHRQRRPCYLYAFSGMGDLRELELDMSQDGLRKVLDFLRSSFGGGTYLEDALHQTAERLKDDSWRNADLLIVTDGQLDVRTGDEEPIYQARREFGTKVFGLVLANSGGDAMERLCDELYVTGDVRDGYSSGSSNLAFPKLKLVTKGIDVAQKRGASLASSLTEEGYSFVSCSVDGEANSIFWDRSRWEMVGKEEGAVLSVSLRPLEDPAVTIRALCFKAKACPEPTRFFSSTDEPLLVCTDLSWLGGVQAAGILEDLMGLPSVTEEVLGTEVAAHMPAPPGLSQDCELAPVRCATGLNRLRFPDAVFFHEMAAVAALSGHSEGYMASMPPEDVVHQFPCFRLPIVAAFDWRAGRAGSDEERELLDIGLPPGLF
ncbi:viaA [Symbiodinium natans]|uniref:ViaA protein n=1 Tax=Symbiodinium natans TaxID=878477 RepID=A0A812SKN7_9DINO|nr:viaA [Symbiodinium natans]